MCRFGYKDPESLRSLPAHANRDCARTSLSSFQLRADSPGVTERWPCVRSVALEHSGLGGAEQAMTMLSLTDQPRNVEAPQNLISLGKEEPGLSIFSICLPASLEL